MAGERCSVDYLATFQCPSRLAQVVCRGTDVILCNGGERVFLYSSQEQKLQAVFVFGGRVKQLAKSLDGQSVYALCENDGIYCISLQQHRRKLPSSPCEGDTLVQLEVSPDSCALRDPAVCSFSVLEEVLVAVAWGGHMWKISFYKLPESPMTSCRKLEELQVPILSTGCPSIGAEDRGKDKDVPPSLCCIYPSGASPKPSEGDGLYSLEPILFGLLFGVDAALLSSPVILCGLPDGRLCCLPVRLPGKPGDGVEERRVKMLFHLGQPVAFIGASLAREKEKGPCCLIAVGSSGKVLLVKAEGGVDGRVAEFKERCLSGPVQSACLSSSHLYYSTGSDLLALLLGSPAPEAADLTQRPSSEQALQPPALQPPISLNVCGLLALTKPTETPTGAVQLLAFSLRGRLLRVTLPKRPGSGHGVKLSAAQVGQKMKDLLAGIGNVSDRVSTLKRRVQEKNDALRSLNQVFNICCLLIPNQKQGEDGAPRCKCPISCRIAARWSRLLQQDSLLLSCFLENSSDYVLEHGWTLCIQVFPPPYPLTPKGEGSFRTYSFPFDKLLPGQNLEVTLPLATDSELSLPVSVCCSLTYTLPSILRQEGDGRSLSTSTPLCQLLKDGGCISLTVDTFIVDWLDCLWINGSAAEGGSSRSKSGSPADPVQTLLSSSRNVPGQTWDHTPLRTAARLASDRGPYLASLRVSSELLKTALKISTPGPPLSIATLCWLVSSNLGGELARQDCPLLSAVCPGGATLRLLAKEVSVTDFCADGPITTVEIQIESSSLAELCGLHHAVLRRVQAML
ncbi:Fanconi anemia core complex-associated protein 100 isoform X2 [Amia ocellicauda]|uniref:Fanconi anemia core complex-associated protein 100 isoform X2 n=1 Tax=Amia ocellicauda TaxID=2972642 RepID=UPI003464DF26